MNISNLNYLEFVDQETGVVGSGPFITTIYDKKNIDINEQVKLLKLLATVSLVSGHSALSQSSADAIGAGSNSQAFQFTSTTPLTSSSTGLSVAQSA